MIFSWLSHDFSWPSYDLIITFSLFSHDFLMSFSWLSHDLLMALLWLYHYILMAFLWLYITLSWILTYFSQLSHNFLIISCNFLMTCSRLSYKFHMSSSLLFHGFLVTFSWLSHDGMQLSWQSATFLTIFSRLSLAWMVPFGLGLLLFLLLHH